MGNRIIAQHHMITLLWTVWTTEHGEATDATPTMKPTLSDAWMGQRYQLDTVATTGVHATPGLIKDRVTAPPTNPDEWNYGLNSIKSNKEEPEKIGNTTKVDNNDRVIDPWFGEDNRR